MPRTSTELVSSSETYRTYNVNFYDDEIFTTVTHAASIVDDWIDEIRHIHRHRLRRLIVGLDIEWRPTFRRSNFRNKVAILQLCVGRRVLIFQLIYADSIPESLIDFLENPDFKFVGVGINEDVHKLDLDYDLEVHNTVDLRVLAVEKYGNRQYYSNIGLKNLAREVLGKELEKPRNISTSNWSTSWLTIPQVQYACLDAFASFEIGRVLSILP